MSQGLYWWNPCYRHIIYIWFRDFCLNTVAQYYTHKHPSVASQSWYAFRLFLSIELHRHTLISNKVLCSHRCLKGIYSMWCTSCFPLAVGMFFLWGAQCLFHFLWSKMRDDLNINMISVCHPPSTQVKGMSCLTLAIRE